MRALWSDSREWLLGEWIYEDEPAGILSNNERSGPCTRPWCWWELDSTEPRRQLSDGPTNSTMDDDHPSGGKMNYGIPQCFAADPDWHLEYASTSA